MGHKTAGLAWLFWACAAPLGAADLGARVRELLESPAAGRWFWGVQAVDVKSGAALCDYQSNRFFVPASNTKLFTTALALDRLGPDHRFHTTVTAARPLDAQGRLDGDLTLWGGGDPNLSARPIPYKHGAYAGNPFEALDELAEQLVARGLRRVNGGVVGDDTAYVWQPYAEGWAMDDALWEYGAPVSALSLNDNSFTLIIRPGGVRTDPAAPYRIDNRLRVEGQARKVRVQRAAGSRVVRIWGSIPAGDAGEQHVLAVDDPALWSARVLTSSLLRRGVILTGEASARHLLPGDVPDLEKAEAPAPRAGVELARRTSAPLLESLRVVDKVSQNLHAEMTLREVARVRRHVGSREAGLKELRLFLDGAGVDAEEYNWRDGSGLSRLNLVSPRAVVKLLRYMYDSPQRENWISLLPVAGEDGTLSGRMKNTGAQGRIHAKTGTLSHVSALSGYAQRADGGVTAFSILVNNYQGAAGGPRAIVDKICNWMVE